MTLLQVFFEMTSQKSGFGQNCCADHHNLFYTLRVYIQYNKICSNNKVHGIAKALNFYK